MQAIARPLGCAIVHCCHRIQASVNFERVHIGNHCSRINTRAGVLAPGCCSRRAVNLYQLVLAQRTISKQVIALGWYHSTHCNHRNIVLQRKLLLQQKGGFFVQKTTTEQVENLRPNSARVAQHWFQNPIPTPNSASWQPVSAQSQSRCINQVSAESKTAH